MPPKCPSCKLLFPESTSVRAIPPHLRDGLRCRPAPVKREAVAA